ncbi:rCG21997 [Rattus norvegicus]|uniref:RCG21997 n=1 Tax=Rattus norvegicus TaxID=10116 RepID=A6K4B7_RAT|nr:rCG21997 [Rattus norvegicus]
MDKTSRSTPALCSRARSLRVQSEASSAPQSKTIGSCREEGNLKRKLQRV